MERLRLMVIMFGLSVWMFCGEEWPLYPKTVPCSSGPYVKICKSLVFSCLHHHIELIFYRDPQGLCTDAELISSLQRCWLLPNNGPNNPAAEAKFSLDSTVGDEG